MASEKPSLEQLEAQLGQEVGVSAWLTVDQPLIDRFAAATFDDQWIHVDVERAQRESPAGATIAHGFLTLSLLPFLRRDIPLIPIGVHQVINYGADSIRFIHPVVAGSRVRLRLVLTSLEPRGENRILIRTRNTIEIENQAKPALVADLLTLVFFARS